MNIKEINLRLINLAYTITTPFCYLCYKKAPSGICSLCHSDDMMRHLEGVGVEYGTCWVIEHIVSCELQAVDEETAFKQMIDCCYSRENQIGFIQVSTSNSIKELDPVSWDQAKKEYISSLILNEQILKIGEFYYWCDDIVAYLEMKEKLRGA